MATDKISGKEVPPEFETSAKRDEYIALHNRPEKPAGKVCGICGERLWHKEFYPHVDKHLDEHNYSAFEADINFDQERFNELID